MDRKSFLNEIESLLEIPEATLNGNEKLADFPQWDSMLALTFIVMVEEKLGFVVEGVSKAKSVDDLVALVGQNIVE